MKSTLYRGGAMADGRSPHLQLGVSILVEDGRISWIRRSEDEGPRPTSCEYVDAGGTTIVPGLVDGRFHLTMPGGPDQCPVSDSVQLPELHEQPKSGTGTRPIGKMAAQVPGQGLRVVLPDRLVPACLREDDVASAQTPAPDGRPYAACGAARHRSSPEKICRKNRNTFSMSRKIDAASNGAVLMSCERRIR